MREKKKNDEVGTRRAKKRRMIKYARKVEGERREIEGQEKLEKSSKLVELSFIHQLKR